MSEQELRGKIVKILEEYRDWFVEEDYKRDIAKIDYTGIADALIEEGIGDVSEYKHRAEVAERALCNACRNIIADEKDGIEVEPRDEVLYKAYLWQAEKELKEERKDEQFYL